MVESALLGATTKSPTFISYPNFRSIPAQTGIAPALTSGYALSRNALMVSWSWPTVRRSGTFSHPTLMKPWSINSAPSTSLWIPHMVVMNPCPPLSSSCPVSSQLLEEVLVQLEQRHRRLWLDADAVVHHEFGEPGAVDELDAGVDPLGLQHRA